MLRHHAGPPPAQGLYRPQHEHDACGVGFVASIPGMPSHALVRDGLALLCNLRHRGATGSDPHTGDGAGLLVQQPEAFLRRAATAVGI
ncbi:MAG TPA: class II glutamine amidotransferase, partial [Myxococcota bacterium]|nr:class II glutamine amidotransferase [Myxococcota bacterium]